MQNWGQMSNIKIFKEKVIHCVDPDEKDDKWKE
jgi:hypothetical protein